MEKQTRIYVDGIYDMFHYGHMRQLQQAKKLRPNVYLLVGVCDDATTLKYKGKTVLNEYERAESIRHCKYADEVIEHAPWVVDQEFLDKHNIDYVAHDEIPYASAEHEDAYAFVKEKGKFLCTQRTDGISTSDLITRIVRDYDAYLRRNLSRGYTAKDMNITFFKEQEIRLKTKTDAIQNKVKSVWETWESSDTVRDFLQLFEPVTHFVKGIKPSPQLGHGTAQESSSMEPKIADPENDSV